MADTEVETAIEPTILARFPRRPRSTHCRPEEIRISINEHGGEIITSVRTWWRAYLAYDDFDGHHDDGYKPCKGGASLHVNELREARSAFDEAIKIAEAAGQSTEPVEWTPRRRRPPIASEVRRLRRYAEPLPFEVADIPFGRSFTPREQFVMGCIKAYDQALADRKPPHPALTPEIMEQGRKRDGGDNLPF